MAKSRELKGSVLAVALWSVVASALLSGCGGGSTEDTRTIIKLPRDKPVIPESYTVAVTEDLRNGQYAYRLNLVDPIKGQVLQSLAVDDEADWSIASRSAVSADGLSSQQLADVELYFLEGGRIKALDLALSNAAPTARQVSTVRNACDIYWSIPANTSADNTWLAVTVADAGGSCQNAYAQRRFALVNSSMDATEAPVASPFNPADLFALGRRADGTLEWFLTFNATQGKLVQWALDGTGATPSDVAGGTGIPVNADVRLLNHAPGSTSKVYLQIDADGDGQGELRAVSRSAGTMSLSASLGSFAMTHFAPAVDAERMFFISDGQVYTVNLQDQVETLASLNQTLGAAVEALSTDKALWVVQFDGTLTTLSSIDKTSGTVRQVAQHQAPADASITTSAISIVGIGGDRVVYTLPAAADSDMLAYYTVANASDPTPWRLTSRAYAVGARDNPAARLGNSTNQTHVFWCDVAHALDACRTARLKSYHLASGTVTEPGAHLGAEGQEPWDSVMIWTLGLQGDIVSTATFDTGSSALLTGLWQFTIGTSNSLKRIDQAAPL